MTQLKPGVVLRHQVFFIGGLLLIADREIKIINDDVAIFGYSLPRDEIGGGSKWRQSKRNPRAIRSGLTDTIARQAYLQLFTTAFTRSDFEPDVRDGNVGHELEHQLRRCCSKERIVIRDSDRHACMRSYSLAV